MEPFDSLHKLITEHGSADILRERLKLAEEQYTALERKVGDLTRELEAVKRHNEVLRQRISSSPGPNEYVSARGVLWKRSPEGFEPEPYCPKCKVVLYNFPPNVKMFWNCSQCKMTATHSDPPKD